MTGRNLNGKFSICRIELQDDSDSLNYFTVRWGYDTEEAAVAALSKVANEEAIAIDELAVVGVVLGADLER